MKTYPFLYLLIVMLSLFQVNALKNPSAVYCTSMNYEVISKDQNSFCHIPNSDNTFEIWKFYYGEVGQEYSYCKLNNYSIKTIDDRKICNPSLVSKCAVCIINGKEVPIATAMKLDFREEPCGDNQCTGMESYESCPQDCPSGGKDRLCDEVNDNICDPDCANLMTGIPGTTNPKDPDCAKPERPAQVEENNAENTTEKNNDNMMVIIGITGIIIAIITALLFIKKHKNN